MCHCSESNLVFKLPVNFRACQYFKLVSVKALHQDLRVRVILVRVLCYISYYLYLQSFVYFKHFLLSWI